MADYAVAATARRDELAARICAVVYNAQCSRRDKLKTVEDFLPVEADE